MGGRTWVWAVVLAMAAMAGAGLAGETDEPGEAVLTGRCVLPADTFGDGPPVGAALDGPINGRVPPFPGPPVQGFSSLIALPDGRWLALQDNGFGTLANSGDYPLRLYTLRLDWDAGAVHVDATLELSDPLNRLDLGERRLTGDDLDPESMVRMDDGSLWLGEEFGPSLVHVDAAGRVLGRPAPVPVPETLRPYARGLDHYVSPDHPSVRRGDPKARFATNHPRSGGVEGLARTPSGERLFVALEKGLTDDPESGRRAILEFDPAQAAFTGRAWFYRTDLPDGMVTSLEAWSAMVLLVMERDGLEGEAARVKRVYRVDLRDVGDDGFLAKRLVCDLLDIADPGGVTTAEDGALGLGPRFAMPFVTPEALAILDDHTLLIANDNNYPFSAGRRAGAPDDNEVVRVRVGDLGQ
jgi:hypothetical protein